MGSLIVKIDEPTQAKLKNIRLYSDLDMLNMRRGGDVPHMVYDVEAVKQSIRNILMWRVGENVIRPEFGHRIHRSMYEQLNDFNKDRVCEEIKRAIEENEPRAKVKTVDVSRQNDGSSGEDEGRLEVRVVYSVIGSDFKDADVEYWTEMSGK